jgi:hypothetical protein
MVNSHCGLVPSTTNSLYSDTPHHDGAHIVQMNSYDSNDVAIDNLVILSPNDNCLPEPSSKYIDPLVLTTPKAHHGLLIMM